MLLKQGHATIDLSKFRGWRWTIQGRKKDLIMADLEVLNVGNRWEAIEGFTLLFAHEDTLHKIDADLWKNRRVLVENFEVYT